MWFVATFIAVFVLGDLAWWWRADRRVQTLPHAVIWRVGVGMFALGQLSGLALILAGRWAGAAWEDVLVRPWLSAVFVWHFLALAPWLLVRASVGVGQLMTAAARAVAGARRSTPTAAETGLSRREFLGAAGVLAPAVLSLAGTGVALPQLERFRIRRIEVPLTNLPAALDGLTIAHLSDLHVGRFTHGAILDRIVEATNGLNADLAVLTGDIINFGLRDLPAAISVVNGLRASGGVFACIGNHDLIEDGAAFIQQSRDAGMPLLLNETAELQVRGERVQLLGLRWGSGSRGSRAREHGDEAIGRSMAELLAMRAPDAFPILLAHHPHAFDFAEGVPLTLAGHTHGGQIMFTEKAGGGPWLFRYWSGLYERVDRALVVSNGVGNWFPLRINAPAEIVHLTLRRSASVGA
jgi:hypothetical protein